jgi:hypothetical protein
MLPLYDESHFKNRTPWAVPFLIVLNTVIFFISLPDLGGFIRLYGLEPQDFLSGRNNFAIIASLFLHAGFLHLLGNMWFLRIFGANVERRLGGFKFLAFYLICGLGSALLYSLAAVNKEVPVIGASGAVGGILGAYLVFFPRNKIKSLVPLILIWTIISVPAAFFIVAWFILQFVSLVFGSNDMVAYWGHIGGFMTGFFLAKLIKRF